MAETYSVDSGSTALAAATAKTLVEISAASTVSARLVELCISCDATGAGTLKVEEILATTGTGTAYTPKRKNGQAQNRAALVTAKINDSVEPTSVTVIRTFWLPLPSGPMIIQKPLDREQFIAPSTMFGVRLTASIVCNAAVTVEVEE